MRDTLHHATIAAQRVGTEVDHVETGAIEVGGLPARRDRHANTGGNSLSQWTRGCLNTRGPAIFGMARAAAVELAKTLDIVERNARLADRLVLGIYCFNPGQVQQAIEQRRSMPHRQDE